MDTWQEVGRFFAEREFPGCEIAGERATRYCGILRFKNCTGGDWVLKVIMPEDSNVGRAHYFNESSRFFRTELSSLGVPLAQHYRMDSIGSFALQLSSDEGADCEKTLTARPDLAQRIVEQIVSAIYPVLYQGEDPIVGLDPQLSNFCWKGDKTVYIDTFPPLCRFRDQYLVHYPNPQTDTEIEREVGRKFMPLGILRRLRFSLIAIDPALAIPFDATLDLLDRDLRERARSFFSTIPNGNLKTMSPGEILRLVDDLPHDDVEGRREVAAFIIPMSLPNRAALLQEVFCNTSLVPLPHLPPLAERLQHYRELISTLTNT